MRRTHDPMKTKTVIHKSVVGSAAALLTLVCLVFHPWLARTQQENGKNESLRQAQPTKGKPNLPAPKSGGIYEELYHGRVVADLAVSTALLKRLEGGDIRTV